MKTCFVSTPFGIKPTSWGGSVDFDFLYKEVIKPVVSKHGYNCVRMDELKGSAVIHTAQLAAIINSDAMIVDVSTHNPNVLYELGMRHAINPGLTIVIFNNRAHLPYDLQAFYMISYEMSGEKPIEGESQALQKKLGVALSDDDNEKDRYRSPLHDLFPELHVERPRDPCVFIGHGRSKLWARLQVFLQDDLGLQTVTYEKEGRAGLSIVPILERMLRQATFAVLVLTGEDETAEGAKRARQNVIHEAGLFQGILGFLRAVMLVQRGLENFSNVEGLQYIEFEGDKIDASFWELQRALKREGLIKL